MDKKENTTNEKISKSAKSLAPAGEPDENQASSSNLKEQAQENNNEQSSVQKARAGRVIIRNLQFDMRERHLQKEFCRFGKIVEVTVPMKNEGNLNRGFGFVEFETKE